MDFFSGFPAAAAAYAAAYSAGRGYSTGYPGLLASYPAGICLPFSLPDQLALLNMHGVQH